MPYEIDLSNPLDGISLSNTEKGEVGDFARTAFVTDAHGDIFYRILVEIEKLFLKPYRATGLPVSMIDNCLILIEKNKATVYINETNIHLQSIATKSVKSGSPVTLENAVGILALYFPEITISENNSIIYYFSIGWKRGVFFDFRPNSGEKLLGIQQVLGAYYEELLYSHILYISEKIWEQAYELGWFPFITLMGDAEPKLRHFLGRIEEGKTTEQSEERLVNFFDEERLSIIHRRIKNNPELKPHVPFIDAGIERYLAHEYLSSINNIWPRIEGILRYIYGKFYMKGPNYKELIDNIQDVVLNKTLSPGVFFPERFRKYLLNFYLKRFDLPKGQLNVSRHSIGHGVSDADLYDQKHALLGILMVDQLGFYIRRPLISSKST